MNGLKLEPGCRQAWVTWLNLLRLKSKPPTSAVMAPFFGLIATSAASTSGSCASRHCGLLPTDCTRTTAPGVSIRPFLPAAQFATHLSEFPEMSATRSEEHTSELQSPK